MYSIEVRTSQLPHMYNINVHSIGIWCMCNIHWNWKQKWYTHKAQSRAQRVNDRTSVRWCEWNWVSESIYTHSPCSAPTATRNTRRFIYTKYIYIHAKWCTLTRTTHMHITCGYRLRGFATALPCILCAAHVCACVCVDDARIEPNERERDCERLVSDVRLVKYAESAHRKREKRDIAAAF